MSALSQFQLPTIVKKPNEVRTRLQSALGLTVELVQATAKAWASAESSAPVFGPRNGAGSLGWIHGTARFREDTTLFGYVRQDPNGSPLAVNKELGTAIAVTKGDNVTGLDCGALQPTTKNDQGSTRIDAVDINTHQFDLFGLMSGDWKALTENGFAPKTREEDIQPTLWLVLLYVDLESAVLRAEVSCPRGRSGDRITDWSERILIPEFQWRLASNSDDHLHSVAEDIDVPIERVG